MSSTVSFDREIGSPVKRKRSKRQSRFSVKGVLCPVFMKVPSYLLCCLHEIPDSRIQNPDSRIQNPEIDSSK